MEIKRYLLSVCQVNVWQVNSDRWGDDFSPRQVKLGSSCIRHSEPSLSRIIDKYT